MSLAYLHPNIKLTRTVTGRLATGGYPILGLPKHSDDGKRIRGLAKAPDWAWFYEIDYSQIELRTLAELSKDTTLVTSYKQGIDIHSVTAHKVLGAPADKSQQDKSKHRLPAKTVNFSIVMGTTGVGLSASINKALADDAEDQFKKKGVRPVYEDWTQQQAEDLIGEWLATYADVAAFMAARRALGVETGRAYGMWGAEWFLPGCWAKDERAREETLRQTHALPVQEGAQRLLKMAMRAIWERDLPWAAQQGARVLPILQYHDALEFLVEKEFLMNWHQRVKATMEGAAKWTVPIVAEGSYGPSWAEQKEIDG